MSINVALVQKPSASPMGILSWNDFRNQRDDRLWESCPTEFKDLKNPWTQYTAHVFGHGASIKLWNWRQDIVDREATIELFRKLLWENFTLPRDRKYAITGWFLSLLLQEPPEVVW